MKISSKFALAAVALLAAGSAFSANQIHLTTEAAKGGTMLGMDIVGDGKATGFQFTVKVPGLQASDKMAKSGCVAQLPKSYLSSCVIANGEVRVAALDSTGKAIPAALTSVGSVFLPGVSAQGKAASLELTNVEFADGQGNALPFEGNVDAAKVEAKAAAH